MNKKMNKKPFEELTDIEKDELWDQFPRYLMKCSDNLNLLQELLTDEGYETLCEGKNDQDKIHFTCFGITRDMVNEKGEEFTIVITDKKFEPWTFRERIEYCRSKGSSMLVMDDYIDKETHLDNQRKQVKGEVS